jgi:hypothetical protein
MIRFPEKHAGFMRMPLLAEARFRQGFGPSGNVPHVEDRKQAAPVAAL